MDIIKVRRVGHSNVISLPRQFEAAGFTPGTDVVVEQTEGGALLITPVEVVRAQRRALAQRAIATNQPALDMLAARGAAAGGDLHPLPPPESYT